MLIPFAEKVWTCQQPLRFFGIPIGARMTVIDVTGNGDLWVHSPVQLSEPLIWALKQRGTVKYVVAPNCWHHFFVKDFQVHFPDARFWCAPGLEAKRKDLTFEGVLEDGTTYPWSSGLHHQVIQGCPRLNEVVFFHPASQSLIITDLGLHICEDSPWLTRFFFKLMGSYRRFGWSTMEKKILIRNKDLFYQSIESLLNWDFHKILLCHGRLIQSDGKRLLKQAFKRP